MRVKIESFLREVCEKTTQNNEYPVLTSSKSGLFLQSDYFNKQVASTDNTGYKIIKKGQFTYRAMSDTGEFYPNMLECVDVGIVSPAYPVFEIFQTDIIIPEYLKYYFKSNAFQHAISSFAQGSTRTSVKFNKLKTASIDLPSKQEQTKILRLLKKAETLIACRQQELHKLDDLVKARFVEMFGDVIRNSKSWEIRVLADIASSRLGKMLDTKQQTGECSYPYLANFNVQWFRFNTENLNQMDFNEEDRIEFELQNDDLLVCEGGEIGRCAVWHNEIQPCFFQKALHRVRCNRQIVHPDYLGWWFKYNCDHDGFATIAGAKATIAHLPGVKLKQLRVAIPPLELQEQFAAFVNQIDKSKFVVQQALDKAQLLFDSLMQQYFG